jgi:hypothetical membrane protein
MKNRIILFAKLAIAMAITYQLLAIIMIFLRPDLGVYWHTISEWAIGKYGWLMQITFITSGLSYLFLYLSIKSDINGRWGKLGLVFLFICFLGTVGVGVFVTDPYPPDFTITTTLIHTICGTLAMILLPFAALILNRNLVRKNIDYAGQKRVLLWSSVLPLIVFIGFFIHLNLFVIPLGENAVGENVPIGYPPRLLFLTYHIWLVILSSQIINKSKNI